MIPLVSVKPDATTCTFHPGATDGWPYCGAIVLEHALADAEED